MSFCSYSQRLKYIIAQTKISNIVLDGKKPATYTEMTSLVNISFQINRLQTFNAVKRINY